jgi:hypothetical protein
MQPFNPNHLARVFVASIYREQEDPRVIWSNLFAATDSIELNYQRVYPKTAAAAAAQIRRIQRQRAAGPSAELRTGLEEQAIAVLDEAEPQGDGVVVIEAGAFKNRGGLEEFVGRIGPALKQRVVLFGADSASVQELAARNGVTIVASNDLVDLAFHLSGMEERGRRVGYLGDAQNANRLSTILLPGSTVTALDPQTVLPQILLFLGYPSELLSGINASGLEEQLARSTAA